MSDQSSKVLIIDDDAQLRDLLVSFFEAKGFDVVEATSGRMGLEMAGLHHPALIITDIIMPDMNGIDCIKELKRLYKRTSLIAMSGYQDELNQVERFGVVGTFLKPPNLEEMANLASLQLEKRRTA